MGRNFHFQSFNCQITHKTKAFLSRQGQLLPLPDLLGQAHLPRALRAPAVRAEQGAPRHLLEVRCGRGGQTCLHCDPATCGRSFVTTIINVLWAFRAFPVAVL